MPIPITLRGQPGLFTPVEELSGSAEQIPPWNQNTQFVIKPDLEAIALQDEAEADAKRKSPMARWYYPELFSPPNVTESKPPAKMFESKAVPGGVAVVNQASGEIDYIKNPNAPKQVDPADAAMLKSLASALMAVDKELFDLSAAGQEKNPLLGADLRTGRVRKQQIEDEIAKIQGKYSGEAPPAPPAFNGPAMFQPPQGFIGGMDADGNPAGLNFFNSGQRFTGASQPAAAPRRRRYNPATRRFE